VKHWQHIKANIFEDLHLTFTDNAYFTQQIETMYIKRNYSFWMTFKWSKAPFLIGLLYTGLIALLNYFAPISLALPWQPISVVGIAVAFYLGFKNNSSYDRTWEARKIWGAIAIDLREMINDENIPEPLAEKNGFLM